MDEERAEKAGSGEERIDAEGRNPTQQRMDEEGVESAPVDASWSGEAEGEGAAVAAVGPAVPASGFQTASSGPPAGSDPSGIPEAVAESDDMAGGPAVASGPPEGSDTSGPPEAAGPNEPIFEPDVSLAAEVNREAGGGKARKGLIAAVAGGFAVLGAALLRRRR